MCPGAALGAGLLCLDFDLLAAGLALAGELVRGGEATRDAAGCLALRDEGPAGDDEEAGCVFAGDLYGEDSFAFCPFPAIDKMLRYEQLARQLTERGHY